MKYLITESKLKQTLFKYYDSIFEDWYFVENGDWEGVSVPKYEGQILVGFQKNYPETGYYFGNGININLIQGLFGLSIDDQKEYLKEYVEEKFNLKFDTLM